MDLSLLTTSASEYNKQRTGAQFTVRPASSPFYSLTRKSDVRKPIYISDEKGEHPEEVQKTERYVTNTGANGTNKEEDTGAEYHDCTRGHSSVRNQCEEKETSTKQSHNDTTDTETHKLTEFGTDRSGNPAFDSCGRTERKKSDFLNRSKSLDCRAGTRQSDFGTGADMLSTEGEKQAGELDEKRRGVHSLRGKVASSLKGYNSSGTSNVIQESHTLDRAGWGHSLPSRLKSLSDSKFTDTSFSPRGGQTIVERIEKLYGSAGFGKVEDYNKIKDVCASVTSTDSPQQKSVKWAEGGTFPRRSSSREKNSLSPGKTSLWTLQEDASGAHNSLSAVRSRRLSGGQWQDQMGYSCEGRISSGKELEEVVTRSLDRAVARANTWVIAHPEPTIQSFLKEETSVSFKGSGLRESRAIERKDRSSRANHREARGECKKINGAKEAEDGVKEKADFKCSNAHEDVFESNSQEIAMKSPERNKFPKTLSAPSKASVRNKINQFEALSHRAQSLGTQQVLMPRRALSVPTQLGAAHEGEKMSRSAKTVNGLKDVKWEGKTIYKSHYKAAEAGKKFGSERSLSVDFVRPGSKEREVKDLVENEETELNAGKNCGEDFGKYSKLKSALEIPLNAGPQRRRENFYIDETDFSKVLSPEEDSKRDKRATHTPPMLLSIDTSGSLQKRNPSVVTSPASDDDKTPTNTPNNSPFLSLTALIENGTPNTDTTCVFTQTAQTPRPDSQPLPHPLAASSFSNIPGLISSPDVNTAFPKDLNAWVAGLNSEIKAWKDSENDYEDDDDSTQKDEDSNYDSDSGESSVTITSNTSQSDRRSFCVSLSDLCNYTGVEYESENDSDEWQSTGRRSVSLSSDVSALSYVSVMPSEELDRLLEDVRTVGDNTLQDCDDVQVVVLHKELGAGLGFSVAGGVDQNKPVTVHKVFNSGVAAQEGSIREGDQVLSINGTALCGYAHWEALRVLRRAKSREMGVVVLRKRDVSGTSKSGDQRNNQGPTQTLFTKTGESFCVILEKNSRDLGFTLEGGVGSSLGNRPLTVQKIFQGGPLDKVYPGDEVLEIEGVSTVGMTRLEAWTLIRKLHPGPVDVVLRRPLGHLET